CGRPGKATPNSLSIRSLNASSCPLRASRLTMLPPLNSATFRILESNDAASDDRRCAQGKWNKGTLSSDTKPISFRIEETGRADFHFHISTAQEVHRADALSDPLRPVFQQAQSDGMTESGRKRRRGQITFVMGGNGWL